MFRTLLVKVCKTLTHTGEALSEGVREGRLPKENLHAVEANIDWGRRWVHDAVTSVTSGEKVSIQLTDLAMLAVFVVSVVFARSTWGTPQSQVVLRKLVSTRLAA